MSEKKIESGDEETLRKIVSKNGDLMILYGGYEITIKNKKLFKWDEVFEWLIKYRHRIYVIEKNGGLSIIAK